MQLEKFPAYKHSGKFGIHGPILALTAAVLIGFPAGFAYAYLIKWIPFIYLNFILTAAYGFGFGLLTGFLLRVGRVRNVGVALLCGIATGAVAIYFEWNGHLHALAKDAPSLAAPGQILAAMQALYEHGSWSIGRHGTSPVTGFFLGLVWLGEAVLIGGLCLVAAHSMIAEVPYCEKTQCWLDKTKKIETLEAFTKPEHLSAFAAGDLSPLLQAQRRPVGASAFARLTIRHSPRCEEFCTISVANVTITQDRDGDPSESETELVSNLILPKSMMDLVGKFQDFKAPEAAGSEAPAASA